MEHKSKWWTSMIAQHGSEAAVRDFMRAAQIKSRENPNSRKGGFHYLSKTNPELLRQRSQAAARKRWHPDEAQDE